METEHRVFVGNSNDLSAVDDDAVELVVTSPPYPMIEMWDDVFASLDPAVGDALDAGDGEAAFDLMHEVLEATWDELRRVLVDGGIACVNVGDATRTVDGSFRVYQNHARVTEYLDDLGFEPLPDILWRKPANSAAKFMGSGMLPPNAYATLEHEYLLVFRNGRESRAFESTDVRYESAYFWEERNEWFSDVWTDVTGTLQELADGGGAGGAGDELRDRSAAYPLEIPYRLVNMYSTYGDTVLDPFWGTGTTTLAAMVAGRNSVGYELDEALVDAFVDGDDDDDDGGGGVAGVSELADATVRERLARHEEFVARRRADGETFAYDAEHYDFPVTTKQERPMRLYTVDGVERVGGDRDDGYSYAVSHSPYQRADSAETAAERTHD